MSGYDQGKSFAVVAETRRRWSDAEKQALLAEAAEVSISAVARKHGVAASLLFRWRAAKAAGKKSPAPAFVPMMLPAPSPGAAVSSPSTDRGLVEIELAGGRRLRVSGPVDVATLKQVIAVLEGR